MSRVHKIKNHFAVKIGTAVLLSFIALALGASLHAENLAEGAAKASALVKRPVAASPHALEEFPWALRGVPPPERTPALQTYPTNLFEAAARASGWIKGPIAASPHALEYFSWAFSSANPPRRVQMPQNYPGNLFEMAAKASTWANRPIAASPHALEEFPWVLRGFPPPQPHAPSGQSKTENQRHTKESIREGLSADDNNSPVIDSHTFLPYFPLHLSSQPRAALHPRLALLENLPGPIE